MGKWKSSTRTLNAALPNISPSSKKQDLFVGAATEAAISNGNLSGQSKKELI